MAIWRLVTCEPPVASLMEIETGWSLDDVWRGNAMLDYRIAAQREAEKKAGSST